MPELKPDKKEAKKRSVDNLQRLYTVVVSLAVAENLKRLIINQQPDNIRVANISEWLMFISLLFTVVPFYHGANRYLDATYVTNERSAKRPALMVDFIFLFLEGIFFFLLAMFSNNEKWFYTTLAVLLILDIIWVGSTNLTATTDADKMPDYFKWAVINFIAFLLLLIFVWSNLLGFAFWSNTTATSISLVAVAVIRTVLDYTRVWNFYFPKDDDTELGIPAPAPAPLPKKEEESS